MGYVEDWQQISADPGFRAQPMPIQNKVALNYFNERVAPHVPEEHLDVAKHSFFRDTFSPPDMAGPIEKMATEMGAPKTPGGSPLSMMASLARNGILDQVVGGGTEGATLGFKKPLEENMRTTPQALARGASEFAGMAIPWTITEGALNPVTARASAGALGLAARVGVPEALLKILPEAVKQGLVGGTVGLEGAEAETHGKATAPQLAKSAGLSMLLGSALGAGGKFLEGAKGGTSGGEPSAASPTPGRTPTEGVQGAPEPTGQSQGPLLKQPGVPVGKPASEWSITENPDIVKAPLEDRYHALLKEEVEVYRKLQGMNPELADINNPELKVWITNRARNNIDTFHKALLENGDAIPAPARASILRSIMRDQERLDIIGSPEGGPVKGVNPMGMPISGKDPVTGQPYTSEPQIPTASSAAGLPKEMADWLKLNQINPAKSGAWKGALKELGAQGISGSGKASLQDFADRFTQGDEAAAIKMLQNGTAQSPGIQAEKIGRLNTGVFEQPVRPIAKEFAEANQPAIEAQARGTMGRGQQEALAPFTGLTREKMAAAQPGTIWNAEEVRAAQGNLRDAFDLVKNDPSKRADLEQLIKVYTGAGSETGRAMQARQLGEESLPPYMQMQKMAERWYKDDPELLAKVKAGLQALPIDNIRAQAALIRDSFKPGFKDYAMASYINSLLLTTQSLERVGLSGATYNIAKNLGRTLGVGVEKIKGNPEAWKTMAPFAGTVEGTTDGLAAAMEKLQTGISTQDLAEMRVSPEPGGAVMNMGVRAHGANSALWAALGSAQTKYSEAAREAIDFANGAGGDWQKAFDGKYSELIKNPSPRVLEAMQKGGKYMSHLEDFGEGLPEGVGKVYNDIGTAVQNLIMKIPGGRIEQPFIRIPGNIVKKSLFEFNPLGIPLTLAKMSGPAQSEMLGTQMVGAAVLAGLSVPYLTGKMTGAAPVGGSARGDWYRRNGQEFSLRVGKEGSVLLPISIFGGPMASMVKLALPAIDYIFRVPNPAMKNQPEQQNAQSLSNVFKHIGANFLNESFFTGLYNMMQAVRDPERFGIQLTDQAQNFIPYRGLQREVATAERGRTMPDVGTGMKDIPSRWAANTPLLTEAVPAKPEMSGEPSMRAKVPGLPIGYQAPTQINDLLNKLNISLSEPGKKFEGQVLSDDDHRAYRNIVAANRQNALNQMLSLAGMNPAFAAPLVKQALKNADQASKSEFQRIRLSRGGQL